MFLPFDSTLLERVSTHEFSNFLHKFRGKKPVTDLRAFVLKVQARSPRLFQCLGSHLIFRQNRKSLSSSFGLSETARKR